MACLGERLSRSVTVWNSRNRTHNIMERPCTSTNCVIFQILAAMAGFEHAIDAISCTALTRLSYIANAETEKPAGPEPCELRNLAPGAFRPVALMAMDSNHRGCKPTGFIVIPRAYRDHRRLNRHNQHSNHHGCRLGSPESLWPYCCCSGCSHNSAALWPTNQSACVMSLFPKAPIHLRSGLLFCFTSDTLALYSAESVSHNFICFGIGVNTY